MYLLSTPTTTSLSNYSKKLTAIKTTSDGDWISTVFTQWRAQKNVILHSSIITPATKDSADMISLRIKGCNIEKWYVTTVGNCYFCQRLIKSSSIFPLSTDLQSKVFADRESRAFPVNWSSLTSERIICWPLKVPTYWARKEKRENGESEGKPHVCGIKQLPGFSGLILINFAITQVDNFEDYGDTVSRRWSKLAICDLQKLFLELCLSFSRFNCL